MRSGSAQTLTPLAAKKMRMLGRGARACCTPAARRSRSSALHIVECSSVLPLEMRSRSRMSFTRRTSRSELLIAISSICCVFSGRVIRRAVSARVMDELMHDAAQHLVLLVAQHLHGGGI